jgi:hypothetical protein
MNNTKIIIAGGGIGGLAGWFWNEKTNTAC